MRASRGVVLAVNLKRVRAKGDEPTRGSANTIYRGHELCHHFRYHDAVIIDPVGTKFICQIAIYGELWRRERETIGPRRHTMDTSDASQLLNCEISVCHPNLSPSMPCDTHCRLVRGRW